jgi:hypothetical protein
VSGATPAVEAIPRTDVPSSCCRYPDITYTNCLPWLDGTGGVNSITLQPSSQGWRSKYWNPGWKGMKRSKREMIRVAMREQDSVNPRKLGHLHTRRCYPRQEEAELIIEVWIGQYADATEIQ